MGKRSGPWSSVPPFDSVFGVEKEIPPKGGDSMEVRPPEERWCLP